MRQPVLTPQLPNPLQRKPVPPVLDAPGASRANPAQHSPLQAAQPPAGADCKASGLKQTMLPKSTLQPAVLLRDRPAGGRGSSANSLRHVAEQLPYPPARQEPDTADSLAALAEQAKASYNYAPETDMDWTQGLPSQVRQAAPAPAYPQSSGGMGSMSELEASIRSDLVRLRAAALDYWRKLQPKLNGVKTLKKRRLQWAAGLAVLLFLTPIGDRAWGSLEKGLDQVSSQTRTRAAFQFIEDFRQGILADWDGDGLTTDDSGSARATALTLYEGTMDLTDYFMDFDFALDRPSLGWVVRAGDRESYCAFELQQTGTKKDPRYQFVRYPVIGGQPDERERVKVDVTGDYRESGHNRISVRIRGDRVATFLNGRSVDFWTDRVLGKGGIGFWSDQGDSAQIQRVAVYGNEDFWGLALYAALEATDRVKQLFAAPDPGVSQSQAAM